MLVVNYLLAVSNGGLINIEFYSLIFLRQILFYFAALSGWFLENRKIKLKILFIPYYFFIMNLSVYLGFIRFMKGKQSVIWERAKRG
jgi:hypothetical protein